VKTSTFLLVTDCAIGGDSWFQIGYRLILTCVFWLDRSRSMARSTRFSGFGLVWGLRSSIQWIGKWLHMETRAWLWR